MNTKDKKVNMDTMDVDNVDTRDNQDAPKVELGDSVKEESIDQIMEESNEGLEVKESIEILGDQLNGDSNKNPGGSDNEGSHGDEYDEDEDEDYDPDAVEAKPDKDESDDDEEEVQNYSNVQGTVSQVKTRSQLHRKDDEPRLIGNFATDERGLVQVDTKIDVDSVFATLTNNDKEEWQRLVREKTPEAPVQEAPKEDLHPQKIKIELSYTFAGKLVTESKLVDADSAEAKAYLNSTAAITQSKDRTLVRSFVPVFRTVPGSEEPVELRIKLKRPLLIDKVLANGSKKLKLSTLEKSRLDWASFVDNRKIGDELKIGNKAGYLDKQEFLGRIQTKRDEQYQKAKDLEKQRLWKLQQKA